MNTYPVTVARPLAGSLSPYTKAMWTLADAHWWVW